jgi:hypothetical protein
MIHSLPVKKLKDENLEFMAGTPQIQITKTPPQNCLFFLDLTHPAQGENIRQG